MSDLVERLADLTAHRDRDVLDAVLASAFAELLSPQRVAVHRCVGDEGALRWLTRASMCAGDVAPTTEGTWTDFDQLPRLDDRPAWRDCLRTQAPTTAEGPPVTSLFPLTTDTGAVGVLEVCTAQPLAKSDRRSISSTLRLYRNFEGLLDYSERDTLTGLLNRKTFDGAFLKLALPTPGGLSTPDAERRDGAAASAYYIGVVDIDHFKRVNDAFGHLIGDEVLLLLSRVMRGTFRFHDRLYRFGGEEFVVLMRCADDASAAIAFERLRANVAGYSFPQVGHVTVSAGYTAVRANDTPSGAFERADRAVYFAKANGRDQVRSHAALVAAGLLKVEHQTGEVELF